MKCFKVRKKSTSHNPILSCSHPPTEEHAFLWSFRNRGTHNLSLSKELDMMQSSLGAETPHFSKLQLWPEFVLAFYTERKDASKSIKYLWWKTRVSHSCWSQYQDFWACWAWWEGRVNELVQGVSWAHCYCQRTSQHALVAVESTGAQKSSPG